MIAMKMPTCVIGFFLVLCFMFSCKHTINNRSQLIQYVNDLENGLTSHKEINNITTSVNYTPWQLFAIKEKDIRDREKFSSKYQLKDKLFFVFSLSFKNRELLKQLNYEQYSEIIQVLSFKMNEFIELIPDSGQPVEPEICQFQQTYGLSKANSLIIAFKKNRILSYKHLTVRINEFGLNTGNLNYVFNVNDINRIPEIKF
jgi:hypothetical protein